MKKIFKTVPCILAAAFTLASACACDSGISDIRNRERRLRERMREEQRQRLSEREERALEDVDPGFTVDPDCPDCPDCPECPECPDCPDIPEDPEEGTHTEDDGDEDKKPVPPEHGLKPPRKGYKRPKPAPYPLPHD